MAAIDTYIGFLSKFSASAIILESGKQILVAAAPAGDRAATQTLSREQLEALLEECAPTSALADLLVNGQMAFDYAGGPQPVHCTVTQNAATLRIVVAVPDASNRPPLQAAAPAKAAASFAPPAKRASSEPAPAPRPLSSSRASPRSTRCCAR